MTYKNTMQWIARLEEAGELVRIKEYVNPALEIAEITDRVSKHNGPALLFENTGTAFPLLINAMGSEERIAKALGVEQLDDVGKQMEELLKQVMSPKESILDKLKLLPTLGTIASWMPKIISGIGDCQQVVMQ